MRRLFLYPALFLLFCIQSNVQGSLVNRYSFTNGDTTAVDSVGGRLVRCQANPHPALYDGCVSNYEKLLFWCAAKA